MNQGMTLRQLRYFVSAADRGSMTGAANDHFVSQSAVSLAISDLERELDVQLFVRQRSRGLTLTPAGRLVLDDARSLLARSDDLVSDARGLGTGLQGSLSVGCYETIAPFLMPGLLAEFGGLHPDVTVELGIGTVPELQNGLRRGQYEVVISYDLDLDADVEPTPLFETTPYVLLPSDHRLVKQSSIGLKELADEPLVLLDQPQPTAYFLGLFATADLDPTIAERTPSFELLRSLVARGFGYSLLIQRPAGDTSYEGLPLEARPLHDPPHRMHVVAGLLRGLRRTRRAEAFLDHCRDALSG